MHFKQILGDFLFSKYIGIDDSTVLSLLVYKVDRFNNTLIDEWDFDKLPYMINLRVNVWTKSMLSVTSIKKSCLIEVMFSIIELLAFSSKGIDTKPDSFKSS